MKKIEKNKYEVVKSLQIKGVTNISVPIFDYTNNAIAALTIPFVDRIITNDLINFEIFLLEVLANQFNIKYITTKITSVIKKKFM